MLPFRWILIIICHNFRSTILISLLAPKIRRFIALPRIIQKILTNDRRQWLLVLITVILSFLVWKRKSLTFFSIFQKICKKIQAKKFVSWKDSIFLLKAIYGHYMLYCYFIFHLLSVKYDAKCKSSHTA